MLTALSPWTLRGRLALLAALAVFAAITVAGGGAFGVTSRVLAQQVDASLRESTGPPGSNGPPGPAGLGPEQICNALASGRAGLPETVDLVVIRPDGTLCQAPGREQLVVTAQDRAVAAAGVGGGLRDGVSAAGDPVRVLVRPIGQGYAVAAGRSLTEIADTLRKLRGVLLALSVVGALVALVLGLVVARAGLRPVDRLTEAAERVARTNDLALQLDVPSQRRDEVSRLGEAFNKMIAALAQARRRQSQLVADAGHELRTPLTSLRTNIELLVRSERSGRALGPGSREALLTSLSGQVEELTTLVGELVLLAHDEPAPPNVPVRWDAVVDAAVNRVRRRAAGRRIELAGNEPCQVTGDPTGLERAVVNLLDNAVKFSPDGSTVTVRQARGLLTIDDQGPGIPPADRESAFDRFWRGADARGLPGSGLGLSIVADAVTQHGGTVRLDAAPGGGTRAVVHLPSAAL